MSQPNFRFILEESGSGPSATWQLFLDQPATDIPPVGQLFLQFKRETKEGEAKQIRDLLNRHINLVSIPKK